MGKLEEGGVMGNNNPYYQDKSGELYLGDCIEVMKGLPDESVDAVITDPPYGLEFMGKEWDKSDIANNIDLWSECLRVLKPGGHLLSFGGTRTHHRMVCAIEDAGFEIRDMIAWVYGSGFPKSLNIGKAIDKLQGNEREKIGENPNHRKSDALYELGFQGGKGDGKLTKGKSKFEGWGTALKPAIEPITLARKPLSEKNVAKNVLKWGTGGINIDESRVETNNIKELYRKPKEYHSIDSNARMNSSKIIGSVTNDYLKGRWPANLIHDGSEEVRECFPKTKKGSESGYNFEKGNQNNSARNITNIKSGIHFGDSGSAARFFKSIIYISKASKRERNKGCEDLKNENFIGNHHPTVKPVALMEYLIKMVAPKGGIILDPFMGSGSTGIAAKKLGYQFIGIEKEEEYFEIAQARINAPELKQMQEVLF